MRIALLGNGAEIHTVRWANGLEEHGAEIHLISLHGAAPDLNPGVHVHHLRFGPPHGYFLNGPGVRKILRRVQPDLLHTHYASGYGTLGRLSRFHPHVLNVWGSDAFDFPAKSALHRGHLARNLRAADCISSISHVMAAQTRSIYPRIQHLEVVPWGIDVAKFEPQPELRDPHVLTIGTVKKLAPKYGIDTLIQGFAACRELLRARNNEAAELLRLRIVGDGVQRRELEELAHRLQIDEVTQFVGKVPHHDVPREVNRLDIYCALSRLDSESFGVAILEASACGVPVVVSNMGGLKEVVEDGSTGFIVPKEDPQALAAALVRLIEDPAERQRLGTSGRQHVTRKYEWHTCVEQMMDVYRGMLGEKRRAA